MRWLLFFFGVFLVFLGGILSVRYDFWVGTIMAFVGVFVVIRAMTARKR